MRKNILAALSTALLLVGAAVSWVAPAKAQNTTGLVVSVCGSPSSPFVAGRAGPFTIDTTGTLCSAGGGGGGSSSPFAPNGNYTTLTATAASSASTALPGGATVAFQNSTAVDVSCVLATGAASATTNKILVRAGSTVFVTVGSNVNAACINQTGAASNVIVLAGGTGLGTNFGGGSSGGGGGAVTMASGAVASGAYSSGAFASGAYSSGSVASGAFASGALASGSIAAGAMVDLLTMRQTVAAGTVASNSILTGGIYNSTPITMTNGQGAASQFDVNGYLKVNVAAGGAAGGTSSNFGSAFPTPGTAAGFTDGTNMAGGRVGAVSNLAAATGFLDALGVCQYNATPPTVTDTRFNQVQCDVNGNQKVTVVNTLNAITMGDGITTGNFPSGSPVFYGLFNGTSYDRVRSGGVTGMTGVNLQATPSGGATTFKLIGAASNNSTLIGSAGAHTVYSYQTSSISASTPYWLKFYDKATAPTCGSDTPVKVILIPPTNSGNNGMIPVGFSVSLGLGICVVGGIADSDNTSIAASTVAINIDYK